jgi:hypothetical protein
MATAGRPKRTLDAAGWARVKAIAKRNHERRMAAKAAESQRINEERLALAHRQFGYVRLLFVPQVRLERKRNGRDLYGRYYSVSVPEVGDAQELLRDLWHYLRYWRPLRCRSLEDQAATRRLYEEWAALAARVVDADRWH